VREGRRPRTNGAPHRWPLRAGPAAGEPTARRKPGKLSFREQRELEGIEAEILAAEERKASLEAALSDPAYQRVGSAVAGMRAELEQATADVERLYQRWQELEAIKSAGN